MRNNLVSLKPRILLVEDHPFQMIALQMRLNQMGFFTLTPALDRREVLAILATGQHFDLMLCDQHLSDGLGLELVKQAHDLGAISHAVLISGIDDAQTLRNILRQALAQKLPLRACLPKPLSAVALGSVLTPLGIVGTL